MCTPKAAPQGDGDPSSKPPHHQVAGGPLCDTSRPIHHGSVSAQMVDAGVEVLYQLQDEVSKATLAEEVYLAMARSAQTVS